MGAKTRYGPKLRRRLLAGARKHCTYQGAAAEAGIDRRTLYTWMQRRYSLRKAVDAAIERGWDELLDAELEVR